MTQIDNSTIQDAINLLATAAIDVKLKNAETVFLLSKDSSRKR